MRQLKSLQLHYNEFHCPQPNFVPSVTTAANFPNFATSPDAGTCILHSNRMSLPEDPPNHICGESLLEYGNRSVCGYATTLWPNTTIPPTPQYVFALEAAGSEVQVTGMRHYIFAKYRNGTAFTEYAMSCVHLRLPAADILIVRLS